MAEPGELEAGLKGLGFPTGDAVVGQTTILFDVTGFTPLLGLYGAASHNFYYSINRSTGTGSYTNLEN